MAICKLNEEVNPSIRSEITTKEVRTAPIPTINMTGFLINDTGFNFKIPPLIACSSIVLLKRLVFDFVLMVCLF
jgi:hypothetical protein